MPHPAALVTGASSGIGLAIARVLAEEGHGLTIASRRPEKLQAAADELAGHDVLAVAGNVAAEEDVKLIVDAHRERFGRLDVLVNCAGLGIGGPVGELATKALDLQLGVNLRAPVLFYRETADMLREAGALVVNVASIAGKSGQPWLSVYSATKAALIAFTQAMNKELNGDGVKSIALCPGFVDTPMSDFIKGEIPPEQMIRPSDVAEAVRFALRLSPHCLVGEIVFERVGA
jgi:NAD(P)-dependent dehydrogenase (short-subunit alcohol dehydrogenase family)